MTQENRPSAFDHHRGPAAAGARWIVSERSGRWAVGLRREAGPAGMQLHETRSLADGWSMLEAFPSSFLVAEMTEGNVQPLLRRIARLERWLPEARVAVVSERSLANYEWLLREAGAVWFATSPRALRPIAAIAARHLQLAPGAPRDLMQHIWSSLPWDQ